MALEKLGSGLRGAIEKVTRRGLVDKVSVEDFIKDLQRTLIQSDVNVKQVFELSNNIRDKALKEKPKQGITLKEHLLKVVYDELVAFLGEKKSPVELKKQKILLVGLFGSGKTTTSGKLAKYFMKKNLKPALVGCDVHRPAAKEQITQLAEDLGVPVYAPKEEKNAIKIAKDALKKFSKSDVIIFDSAGRDALDGELAKELKEMGNAVKPDEVFLVMPADIGQAAMKQAQEFSKLVGITGVIVTKLDGTAKGGGALSACAAAGAPIKFIGKGERAEDFEEYDPVRFVSRLLGYGDLQGLLEKAREVMEPGKAEEMLKGRFTLEDFYEQIKSTQNMGSLSQISQMLPFGAKVPKDLLAVQDEKMKKWKYIIDSMTPKEKREPDLLTAGRIRRVALGSGTLETDVKELLKFYRQSKKFVKMAKGGGMKRGAFAKIAKQLGM